ncbi:MAG: radical SAM protein [Anaerolineae bacterium]|nr:radical SAM protein [Anaerolineae bacterium]
MTTFAPPVEKPRKRDIYRLPWSMNDNPFGWLEVTDRCNVYCKGCYRQQLTGHYPMEQIKHDILFLKEWRNCDHISIAGGEPLIHPQILEILEFIRDQGLKPLILTNGIRLHQNMEFLRELKAAGCFGFTFHIDSAQRRPGWFGKSELELCELRQQYAEMVASVGGMYSSFGCTIYPSNIGEIPAIVKWANDNIDIVNGLVFITYSGSVVTEDLAYTVGGEEVSAQGELSYGDADADEITLTSRDVYDIIRKHYPHYDAVMYLGGTQVHSAIKWLISMQMGQKGKMFGSVGPKSAEAFMAGGHFLFGRYIAYMAPHRMPKLAMVASLFDPHMRKIHFNFWREVLKNPRKLFEPIYSQSIGIVQGPDITEDGRADMCDSCPDITVWDGKLVHSCRMDEWRIYGNYVTPQVKKEIAEAGGELLPERREEDTDEDERIYLPVMGD